MTKKITFLLAGLFMSMLTSQAQPNEEIQKIFAADSADGDNYGISVSISGDYAIVGANYDNDNGVISGSAYILYNNSGTWQQQAKLTASDGAAGDRFGSSVYLSGDYAIVGAFGDSDNGNSSGSAYIFYNNSGTWEEQAKLTASDAEDGDYFGWSVSLSGNYAIVGAHNNDDNGSNSGSAYIL